MKKNTPHDAMGQRIAKTVTNKNTTDGTDKFVTTYYVRDPQGSVLAVYEHKHGDSDNGTLTLAEQHLYGASRLGMTKPNLVLSGIGTGSADPTAPAVHYELTNHLGNVLAVITPDASDATQPAIVSLSDYYPFGMTEPGRSWNAGDYRFGYTGHEKESDLAEGVYTTEYRLLDARLGRWLSVDKMSDEFAGMSPYVYCEGNPVMMVDPDGNKDLPYKDGDKDAEEDPVLWIGYFYKEGEKDITYNCHAFAWAVKGNPMTEKNQKKLKKIGPIIDIKKYMHNYKQLDPNENNRKFDRVVYYVDKDEDGKYDPIKDDLVHSAVVWEVDDEGNTTSVVAKCGSDGVYYDHPTSPSYGADSPKGSYLEKKYKDEEGKEHKIKTKRAYFRYKDE